MMETWDIPPPDIFPKMEGCTFQQKYFWGFEVGTRPLSSLGFTPDMEF
jgi:hypothetical protein